MYDLSAIFTSGFYCSFTIAASSDLNSMYLDFNCISFCILFGQYHLKRGCYVLEMFELLVALRKDDAQLSWCLNRTLYFT